MQAAALITVPATLTVTEGETLSIVLAGDPGNNATISSTIVGGGPGGATDGAACATSGVDVLRAGPSGSVSSGTTSHTLSGPVTCEDTVVEGNEVFTIVLRSSVSNVFDQSDDHCTGNTICSIEVTIQDDDTHDLTLSVASSSSNEGDGTGNPAYTDINVTVTKPAGTTQNVAYTLCFSGGANLDHNGAKLPSEDYQVINPEGAVQMLWGSGFKANCHGSLGAGGTFPGSGDSLSWKLRIFGDTVVEPNETIIVTLSTSTSGFRASSTHNPFTYTITNDDDDNTLSIGKPANATEGNSGHQDYTFPVTLSDPATSPVGWKVCFTGTATPDKDGGSIGSGADYQARLGNAPSTSTDATYCTSTSIAKGATSNANDLKIRVRGDTAVELDETIIATLTKEIGKDVTLGTSSVTFTIQNDDTTPVVDNTAPRIASITRHSPTASPTHIESNNTLIWEITFNEDVSRSTVDHADFQVSNTNAAITRTRVTGSEKVYRITATGGNLNSRNATLTLSLKSTHGITDLAGNALTNTAPTGTNHSAWVIDNTAPRVTSIARQSPTTLNTDADSLTWRITFSEAVTGIDDDTFEVTGSGSANLGAITRTVSGSGATRDVAITDGNLADLVDTTVKLTFSGSQHVEDTAGNDLTNLTPTGTNHNTFRVQNTPPAQPNVSWGTNTERSLEERIYTENLSIETNKALTADLGVNYTVGGTATLGTDYMIPGCAASPCTFTLPSGTGEFGSVEFPIHILADSADDNGETIVITIIGGSGYNPGNTLVTTLTLYKNTGDAEYGIAGVARQGEKLTIARTKNDPDGDNEPYEYKWYRRDNLSGDLSDIQTWQKIQGTDNSPYTPTAHDVGKYLQARVKYRDGNGLDLNTIITPPFGPIEGPVAPDTTPPQVVSIARHNPTTLNTDADSLTWRITFSEAVMSVDSTAFTIDGTSAGLAVSPVADANDTTYNITASGGDLADLVETTVMLGFDSGHDITDTSNNALAASPVLTGTNENTYIVHNDDGGGGGGGGTGVGGGTGGGGTPSPEDITITIGEDATDGDGQPPLLNLIEGQSAEYQVGLNRAPTSPVTLTITAEPPATVTALSGSGGSTAGGIRIEPDTLTFTPGNWQDQQTVRVTVPEDADAINGTVILRHTFQGGGYDNVRIEPITLHIQSKPVLSVSAPVRIEEGQDLIVTVTANEPPITDLVIGLNIEEDTAAGVDAIDDTEEGTKHLTLTAGQTEVTHTVPTRDNETRDANAMVSVTIEPGSGYKVSDYPSIQVQILDNDESQPIAVQQRALGSWLSRFGPSVSEQALDGITARLFDAPSSGLQGTFAGVDLNASEDSIRSLQDTPLLQDSTIGTLFDDRPARTLNAEQAFLQTRFTLTDEDSSPVSFWGQAARADFSDQTTVSLDGKATTALLGADTQTGNTRMGLALLQSEGEGRYSDEGGNGVIESPLTALIPYSAWNIHRNLDVWTILGMGNGEVNLKRDTGEIHSSDLNWKMASAGIRKEMSASAKRPGARLALTADAVWTRTDSSDSSTLTDVNTTVSRLRMGMKGSWPVLLPDHRQMTPNMEIGLRKDQGDTDNGFGIDFGTGVAWKDSMRGLSFDLSARTLLSHDNDTLKNRGFSAQVGYDPKPQSNHGFSVTLNRQQGARSTDGMEALFDRNPLSDSSVSSSDQWQAHVQYGYPTGNGHFTATPQISMGLHTDTRDLQLGWRVSPIATRPDWAFTVQTTRRESDSQNPTQSVGVDWRVRW